MNTTPPIPSRPYETAARSVTPLARGLATAARILMGVVFLVFGLNGFLNFIPPPSKPMAESVMNFTSALIKTGYMMPLLAGTEVLVGILCLVNRFVPLALALIAPVIVNIVAVHLFLEPTGLPIALVILLLEIYLAWSYRTAYRSMLTARVAVG